MSTNPNNAVGTNAAYDGRTTVEAFNDVLGAFTSRGILSGWACSPNSGMTVSLGGDGTTRDVAIAEDNAGNKTTINNISGSPIDVTMSAAPGSNSRIDLVVAYVDNPPQGASSTADNPSACGIIKVDGTPASTPVAPNDSAIRTAITADGASGSTAFYVVLASITIASGTTDIASGDITQSSMAKVNDSNLSLSGFSGALYFYIGDILVQWGFLNMGSVPNNQDKKVTLNFPITYSSNPKIICSCASWLASPTVCTGNKTTANCEVIVRHQQGTTVNDVSVAWVAFGPK